MVNDHPFLYQARRDLERAETSKAKAEALLHVSELEIHRLKNFIEQYEIYAADVDKSSNISKFKARSRTIADVAVSIIENSEEPLHIQEILERLSRVGVEVGGENKPANLAAYLSKDNRVRFERGIGWKILGDKFYSDDAWDEKSTTIASAETAPRKSSANRSVQQPNRNDASFKSRSSAVNSDFDDDIPF